MEKINLKSDEKFQKQMGVIGKLINAAAEEKTNQECHVETLLFFVAVDKNDEAHSFCLTSLENGSEAAAISIQALAKSLGLGFVHFCKDEHEHEKFFIEPKENKEN